MLEIIQKHISVLLIGLIIILSIFTFKQCSDKDELIAISNQNKLAMLDSSYQLVLTKTELAKTSKQLYNAVNKLDSTKKDGVIIKEVTRIKLVPSIKEVIINNKASYDSLYNKGLVSTNFEDSLKSFDVYSYFKVDTTGGKIRLYGDKSIVENFKLKFDLVSYKEKNADGNILVKTKAFYVDDNGNLLNEVAQGQLSLNTRSVMLSPDDFAQPTKKKLRVESGWGLTITPIAIGVYNSPNGLTYGLTPNIGFSYYFTLKRK